MKKITGIKIMKKIILMLLIAGFVFGQSSLGLNTGQKKMQNVVIDMEDTKTNSIKTVDYAHHEIHDGRHYEVAGSFSLGSGDTSLVCFDAGDTTRWAHMLFSFDVLAATTIEVIEGGAYSDAVNALTAYNNNRNSSNVTVMDTIFQVIMDSTDISRYGTTIFTHNLGAGQQTGGNLGRDAELILAQDSLYLFKITSNAASNKVDYEFQWYEHIDQ